MNSEHRYHYRIEEGCRECQMEERTLRKGDAAMRALDAWLFDNAGTVRQLTPVELFRVYVCRESAGRPPLMRSHAWFSEYAFTYHALYHVRNGRCIMPGDLKAAGKLAERYGRFVHFMTEVRHAWQYVERVHYADNSIERTERSLLTGETRYVQELAPGGDACF